MNPRITEKSRTILHPEDIINQVLLSDGRVFSTEDGYLIEDEVYTIRISKNGKSVYRINKVFWVSTVYEVS